MYNCVSWQAKARSRGPSSCRETWDAHGCVGWEHLSVACLCSVPHELKMSWKVSGLHLFPPPFPPPSSFGSLLAL